MIGTKWVQKGAWASAMPSTASALTAAGSTQATALPLSSDVNLIGTTAASTGVLLPPVSGPGDTVFVLNGGASALLVYPAGTGKVNALAASAGFSLPTLKSALFVAVNATDWVTLLSA